MLGSVVNDERWMEEAIVVAGLICVQAVCAIYVVFISSFLASGLDPFFLVAASGFINAFLLLPLAIVLERKYMFHVIRQKKWPEKIGLRLTVRFALIAIGGPLYQVFMLLGVKKTTPTVATAMPNLGPGLIFIIASSLRIEKFNIKCKYTRLKIMGTLICLSGAMAMSVLLGSSAEAKVSSNLRSMLGETLGINTISNEWMIGCLYLLAAVVALSCVMVLQATTMAEFPAPISLGVITTLMGSTFTGLFQLVSQGNINTGASSVGIKGVVSAVLAGGSMSFVTTSIVIICVHRKGPVFVSVFHPIQTVCAAILSAVILKQFITLGSIGSMALMFAGLYVLLWAKIKEGGEETRMIPDEDKALLC